MAGAGTVLKEYFLSRLTTWLWWGIVIFFVTLAVYASFGRLLTSNLGQYREPILREINERTSFVIEVDHLQGSWASFSPRIELQGVRLLGDEHAPVSLAIENVYVEIDVWESLRTRTLQLYALVVSGARMHVEISPDGQLSLPGLPASGGNLGSPLYKFVANTERLEFHDALLRIHDDAGVQENFVEANLQREEDFRRFNLSLLSPDRNAWFRVVADGAGDLTDISAFKGSAHLETSMGDIAAYQGTLEQMGVLAEKGALHAELWLSLENGRAEVAAKFKGDELHAGGTTDPENLYRIRRLGGALRADYQSGIWSFAVRDVDFLGYEQELRLDHVSGEYTGSSVVLRAVELDLGGITEYLLEGPLLPDKVAGLVAALAPRGRVNLLEFELADLEDLSNWQLSAEVSRLGVDSWKAAPAIENASGYLSISPRDGLLQLDSADFSMFFPTLHDAALEYRKFNAELAWHIDDEAFRLRSGPFTGWGEEGEVRGLFSLIVPLEKTPIGIEMDLLVGLADTRPAFRGKYLTRNLSPKLLDWLAQGLGEGVLREGGFAWRGSLSNRSHRTVQLFFEIEDTHIDYHPQWPPLSEVEGLIMIDNADVDVFARSARLLDSSARDIEVKIRTDEQSHQVLSMTGELSGSAADGLTVINQSPLRNEVGDTFLDWSLDGSLQTRVQLQMDLTDTTQPPEVAVDTRWGAVDMDTGDLALRIEDIDGELTYRSMTGFSGTGITGALWGQPLLATVSQHGRGSGPGELDIEVKGRVEVDSIRDWLQLDTFKLASLAQGGALATAHILVPPQGAARLEVSSDLLGVTLDLPPPWGKAAGESQAMSLRQPLGELPLQLLLNLGGDLSLSLSFGEDGYQAGALGFSSPPPKEELGRFLLGGEVKVLDWEQCSDFLDSYVFEAEDQSAASVLLGVRDLTIGEARVFGQRFEQVRIDVTQLADSWQVLAELDWLKGSVLVPNDMSSAILNLDYLDFEELSQSLEIQLDELNPADFNLPPINVAIADLRSDGEYLGAVSFKFIDERDKYRFTDIRGNLRGLQLGGDDGMELNWWGQSDSPHTQLIGALVFEDFGEVLARYNYDQMIETESGRLDLDFKWPGAPWDFSLATTSGDLNIDVAAGRFLKTSGAAEGTLRVVSIFNLADFVRRLSLDLSYVFQSGIPFDSISGELELQSGIIQVPQLAVVGRSSRFQFVGAADVPDGTIEGELVATLPIASNLPWVAALIAGLPTAAAVYVISKLFTRQMDRFSSAVYQVEGPWDDPEVNFQRIFDDSAELPGEEPDNEGKQQEKEASAAAPEGL
jgi:uncharacterized protein (TIGR02099 family)